MKVYITSRMHISGIKSMIRQESLPMKDYWNP